MRYYTTRSRKFRRGEIIFSENSDCDGMYVINSGRVRVFKTIGAGPDAKEIELCILGPKAMFGEMAMIDNSPRSATVQAIETTECTIITKKTFEDQLSRIPDWMVNMIRILVTRLRETNEKLRVLVEQYTPLPNDDPGSVLTVDPGTAAPLRESAFPPRPENRFKAGISPITKRASESLSGMIVVEDNDGDAK